MRKVCFPPNLKDFWGGRTQGRYRFAETEIQKIFLEASASEISCGNTVWECNETAKQKIPLPITPCRQSEFTIFFKGCSTWQCPSSEAFQQLTLLKTWVKYNTMYSVNSFAVEEKYWQHFCFLLENDMEFTVDFLLCERKGEDAFASCNLRF